MFIFLALFLTALVPDIVAGMNDDAPRFLDIPCRRDPDALPPSNLLEEVGTIFHLLLRMGSQGNVLFAIKGGLLACESCSLA